MRVNFTKKFGLDLRESKFLSFPHCATCICQIKSNFTPNLFIILGDTPDALEKLADGSHPFAKKLAAAKKPAVIIGSEVLQRPDGAAMMAGAQKLAHTVKTKSGCKDWRVLNVLHKVASQVSALLITCCLDAWSVSS